MSETESGEVWRRVPDWPYSASSQGRIRNDRTGYVLNPNSTRSGYLRVQLHSNGRSRGVSVHTLVLEAFRGPRPTGYEANHRNAEKSDNRPENLEWVTGQENIEHAKRHGLLAYDGEKNGRAILTEDEVRQIYLLTHHSDLPQREIAERYGVCRATVGHIKCGENWSSITEDLELTHNHSE